MDSPFMGLSDILTGGHDPEDGRNIDHAPKAVGGLILAGIVFLYLFNNVAGFRVVIGAGKV